MVDMQNQEEIPALEDFAAYIRNPVFMQFCSEIKKKYRCNEKIEFSRCSWERGWNVKFKKSGKACVPYIPGTDILRYWWWLVKKKKKQLKLFYGTVLQN